MHVPRPTPDGSDRRTEARGRRPRTRLLLAAALALGGLLGSVGAASAAPAAPAAPDTAEAAALPFCLRSYSWFSPSFQYVGITNGCGSTQRAKIIVSGGPDSRCYSIAPGHEIEFRVLWGEWDRTVGC